ncbi:cation transporter, partial [Clostridium tyrobutyricum]
MTSKILQVQGMTCAACARNIEKAASRVEGVSEANVNFAAEKLKISYDPEKAKIEDVKKSIEKAGYKALEDWEQADDDKQRKEKEISELKNRFIMSAVFAIPLLIVAMGPMILEKTGNMLPDYMDPMI